MPTAANVRVGKARAALIAVTTAEAAIRDAMGLFDELGRPDLAGGCQMLEEPLQELNRGAAQLLDIVRAYDEPLDTEKVAKPVAPREEGDLLEWNRIIQESRRQVDG